MTRKQPLFILTLTLLLLITVSFIGNSTTSDLEYTVYHVEVSPGREGWANLELKILISNAEESVINVPRDLGVLRGEWKDYTYEGTVEPSDFKLLPPGYGFLTRGEIAVPSGAVSELRLQLVPPHQKAMNVDLKGPWPSLPALPAPRSDQHGLGEIFQLEQKWAITPVDLHIGLPSRPYSLMLKLNVKNLSGYDSGGQFKCQIMSGTSCWYEDFYVSSVPPFMEREVEVEINSFRSTAEDTKDVPYVSPREHHVLITLPSSEQHVLYLFNPAIEVKPSVLWTVSLPEAKEITSFASLKRDVYLGSAGGNVYALDSESGKLLWRTDLPGSVERLVISDEFLWCWVRQESWGSMSIFNYLAWGVYKVEVNTGRIVDQLEGRSQRSEGVEFAGVNGGAFYLRIQESSEKGTYGMVVVKIRIEKYDTMSFQCVDRLYLQEEVTYGRGFLGKRVLVSGGVIYLANSYWWSSHPYIAIKALRWPSTEEIWSYTYDTALNWWPPPFTIVDGTLYATVVDFLSALRTLYGLTGFDPTTGEPRLRVRAESIERFVVSTDRVYLFAPSDPEGPCIAVDLLEGKRIETLVVLRTARPLGASAGTLFVEKGGNVMAVLENPVIVYPSQPSTEVVSTASSVENHPPEVPQNLAQLLLNETEISLGEAVTANTVIFRATVTDSDADKIKLQVELCSLGESFNEAKPRLNESNLLANGSEASCMTQDLIPEEYHWRARAIDEHGLTSNWVEFGDNATEVDFSITVADTQPPTCVIRLREEGKPSLINQIDVGRSFQIYIGDSADNTSIQAVRFSSDDDQDGQQTGAWTDWYSWDESSNDWDFRLKVKSWTFTTGGEKEVWTEMKDPAGNVSGDPANIFVHPGYAIVVSGQGGWRDKRGLDHCANNAYRALRNLGFDDGHIFYLNSNRPQDVDGDGDDEVDAGALLDSFAETLREVENKIGSNATPLILYFSGHGATDCFIFNGLDSEQGYLWVSNPTATLGLRELLGEFQAKTPVLAIVGSCYSGCFIISSVESPGSISAANRIIITANHDDNDRILWGWVRSSDCFWGDLITGSSVKEAFSNRTLPVDQRHLWLDDNGDMIGHAPHSLEDDGVLAVNTRIGVPGSDNLKLKPWVFYWLRSPGELRMYDVQGRVTGLVDGDIREEIPDSLYDEENKIVALFSRTDSYYCQVVGTDEGRYELDATSIENGTATTFTGTDIPTIPGAVHRYTIDWNALARGEEGVVLQMDIDGEGTFEKTSQVGSELDGRILATPEITPPHGAANTWLWIIFGVCGASVLIIAVVVSVKWTNWRKSSKGR